LWVPHPRGRQTLHEKDSTMGKGNKVRKKEVKKPKQDKKKPKQEKK
jgi:hypothetical protein